MPTYTDLQKKQRKYTIKAHENLQKLDAIRGIRPTPPAAVIHHPRFFNAPLSCRAGKHQWENGFIMGIPRMKCKKCGRIVMTGSFNGTETKREIRIRNVPKPEPLLTQKQFIENFFKEVNKNSRR